MEQHWQPCPHTLELADRPSGMLHSRLHNRQQGDFLLLRQEVRDDLRTFCQSGDWGYECRNPHLFRFRHKWQAMLFRTKYEGRVF